MNTDGLNLKRKAMENKLISMTEFVLSKERAPGYYENQIDFYDGECKDKADIIAYARFLKQPLALWMFVPCDEDGNLLEKPKEDDYSFYTHKNMSVQEEYERAKSRVLFEGFYYQSNYSEKTQTKYEYVRNEFPHVFNFGQINKNTVESLLTKFKEEFQITLTETAIKQIYGS